MIKKNNKGITLIALVITIIVLLILASVSIAMLTGDNGILTRAGDAKIETALGAVKEQVRLYQIEKKMDNKEVTPENLLAEGKVSRTVQVGEADKYYMYYALKENSFEGMQGIGKGNIASLKDVFLIDDNLNIKYISSNGKEYGDNLNNKVLDDETEIRFSSKAFSEYVSKISGVTEDKMKFKWMKNQTKLEITDPNIDSLEDLVFFPNLEHLTLRSLNLETLGGIENCKKLNFLQMKLCNIKDYSNMENLEQLKNFLNEGTVENIDILIENLSKINSLTSVGLTSANLKNMNKIKKLENLNNLVSLDLSQNAFTKIEGLENMINLKKLNLWANRTIKEIEGLKHLTNLETLNLQENSISEITDISKNKSLKYLNLKGNPNIDGNKENYTGERLEAINEIGKILDRGGQILLDYDKVGLFKNYRYLDFSYNNLVSINNLKGMTELKELNLDYNKINLEDEETKEVLRSMKSLVRLDLTGNSLKDISVLNEMKTLKILHLGNNDFINLQQIEDIISNLNSMRVSTKALKTISKCSTEKITKLNIGVSGIDEVPDLSEFTNLIQLDLNNNSKISNLQNISKIKSLKSLNLSYNNLHNRIIKIDWSNLTNLSVLNLEGNNLWSEDLENLKLLKNNTNLSINLRDNSIIDASALLELNSNTKIDLRNNINLSQDSKDKLKAKFGKNVTF